MLKLFEDPTEELVVLAADVGVVAEGQVDEELAELLRLLLQFVIGEQHQVLEDHRVDNGAKVNELLLQFLFVQVGELICILRGLRYLTSLLARVDRDELTMLEDVVLQDLGAQREEWLADCVIIVCIN